MIIVKIKGGLGNQLFQYSIGRYLSSKLNTSLKLNILGYDYEKSRVFELNYFGIPDIDTDITPLVSKSFKYYRERQFNYSEDVISIKKNSYLDGYWQCEQYFKPIATSLVKDLQVKEHYTAKLTLEAKEITCRESVAVHIRRGDFLASQYRNNFGILPFEYYKKAIELSKQKLSSPKYYFFSDDIEWVKTNFRINDDYCLISGNVTQTSIEDFYLMTKCNHHIIANSTFSWWSAWLCQNNEKIVIGPKQWFKNPVPNTKDILPKNWITC